MTKFMKHENYSIMNVHPISSVRDLVDAFGGTGKFAEFLNVVPSYVSNMLRDDELPRGYHLEVYLECQRRGLRIDKRALFGIEEVKDKKPNPKRRAEARAVA